MGCKFDIWGDGTENGRSNILVHTEPSNSEFIHTAKQKVFQEQKVVSRETFCALAAFVDLVDTSCHVAFDC